MILKHETREKAETREILEEKSTSSVNTTTPLSFWNFFNPPKSDDDTQDDFEKSETPEKEDKSEALSTEEDVYYKEDVDDAIETDAEIERPPKQERLTTLEDVLFGDTPALELEKQR